MMDKEELTQLERMLSEVSEQFRQQMNDLAKSFTEMFQPMQTTIPAPLLNSLSKIDWPKLLSQMGQSCERLANLGWALPMSFTPRELVELAEHGNTDQQIEQYMLDFFTLDDGRSFMSLRRGVLASAKLVGWRALLEQCFDAYDRRHYLVVIPALLLVVEGAMAQNAGKLKVAEVDPKKFAASLEKAAQPNSIDFHIWRSARVVVDKLFAPSDFGGPHPKKVNRHWILHGRDQRQWTQIDALRLFNLLATIS
jgi:hypothetical protein